MSRLAAPPMGLQEVLDAASALAPAIAARAAEIERSRRLPGDLLDDLLAGGCFAVFRPSSHGGIGADLPGGLRVIESLARHRLAFRSRVTTNASRGGLTPRPFVW